MSNGRIRIAKEFNFDAAHWLPNVEDTHKCRRLHGHTYRVVVECFGPVDSHSGMLVDYAEIAAAWQPIHADLDHRCLNGVPTAWEGVPSHPPILDNPTTENLAWYILKRLRKTRPCVQKVRVYESSTTFAEADAWPEMTT